MKFDREKTGQETIITAVLEGGEKGRRKRKRESKCLFEYPIKPEQIYYIDRFLLSDIALLNFVGALR